MDIETLRKEVTQGNMQALFSLAQKYWQGEGVKKSKKKALELWNEGALKGDGACAFHLGTLYEKGLIVKKDYNQARYYYLIAYRNHHKEGTLRLAYFYEHGLGLYKDIEKAKELYCEVEEWSEK
jgi:TPR repeat protein